VKIHVAEPLPLTALDCCIEHGSDMSRLMIRPIADFRHATRSRI
jgi:hypothetical protein